MTARFVQLERLTLTCAAVLVTATTFAQPPARPETPPTQILTGCLRSSAADVAVAGPSGRIYTLEVVEQRRPAADTPAGGATATKITYSLSVPESLPVNQHADHEVELTGRLQAPVAPAARPGQPVDPGSAKPTAGGGHRTFVVSALKMVKDKCP